MKGFLVTILFLVSTTFTAWPKVVQIAGTQGLDPSQPIVFGDKLVFRALDLRYLPHSVEYELWYYNEVDTLTFVDINEYFTGSFNETPTTKFLVAGNDFYCSAAYGNVSLPPRALYRWNGKDKHGIRLEWNISGTSSPECLTALNEKLYASINYGKSGRQLWEIDLPTGVGKMLTNINPNTLINAYIRNIYVFDNKVYFSAAQDSSNSPRSILRAYDPATGKIIKLTTGEKPVYNASQFMTLDNKLYFTANTDTVNAGTSLCMYDGKNPVQVVAQLETGVLNPSSHIVAFQDKIYFQRRGTTTQRIWAYDLTTQQASGVETLQDFEGNDSTRIFMEYHGKLYFSASNNAGRDMLFNYDGINPPLLVDSVVHDPADLVVYKDNLFFTGRSSLKTRELYKYYEPDSSFTYSGSGMVLYPNPATVYTNFAFTLQKEQALSFIITDNAGKTVYRQPAKNYKPGLNKIGIDVGNFANGIYHCRLSAEDNAVVWTGKLLKG